MSSPRPHRIRVASGNLRGRTLEYPPGRALRPTMQRTREAIFDSIRDELPGARFVDLYAGAGSMGIEAISRGAVFVHFVEKAAEAVEFLRSNLESLGIGPDRACVHSRDVFEFLAGGGLEQSDIVFADSPYGPDEATKLLEQLSASHYPDLRLVIIEHDGSLGLQASGMVGHDRTRSYGDAHVSYFRPHGDLL